MTFSRQARRLASAAKDVLDVAIEHLEEPPSPPTDLMILDDLPTSVPLDRRRHVSLESMSMDELARAHQQARARIQRLEASGDQGTPQEDRYKSYLVAIERRLESVRPEQELKPLSSDERIPEYFDAEQVPRRPEEEQDLLASHRAANVSFDSDPGDTPETPL